MAFIPIPLGSFFREIKKALIDPVIEEAKYLFYGEKWWIVGPMGSGKSTLHKYLHGESVLERAYTTTNHYEIIRRGKSQIQGSHSKEISKDNAILVRLKKGPDYGGQKDYWDNWKEHIGEMKRFIFVYSLDFKNPFKIPPSLEIKNGEIILQKESEGYQNLLNCFEFTLTLLIKTFPKYGSNLDNKYRKLLVLCNKGDQWIPQGSKVFPVYLPFYQDSIFDLKSIANKLQFEEKTGIKLIFGYTTLITSSPHLRELSSTSMHAVLSELLKK